MQKIKDELQVIITGNGHDGGESLIKKAQIYLGGNETPGTENQDIKRLQSEEEKRLIDFITRNNLFYTEEISDENYISEGAEQKVYRYDDECVIKLNDRIFYRFWKDYLNSLLIHNYFFGSTKYELLGFRLNGGKLFSVVKQRFIYSSEPVDINLMRAFLEFNQFKNIRNNDYNNDFLGLVFEDLHDENVISQNGILFFIDTVFYITDNFYK